MECGVGLSRVNSYLFPLYPYCAVEGDFLGVQDHLSSPSSSSQSPAHTASSYSPMSNGSRESEFVPFNLDDLKIETNMEGGHYCEYLLLTYKDESLVLIHFRYFRRQHQ